MRDLANSYPSRHVFAQQCKKKLNNIFPYKLTPAQYTTRDIAKMEAARNCHNNTITGAEIITDYRITTTAEIF